MSKLENKRQDDGSDILFIDRDKGMETAAGQMARLSHEVELLRIFLKAAALNKYTLAVVDVKWIIRNDFIGGVLTGLAAAIGIGVIISLIVYVLGPLRLVPVVGDFIFNLLEYVSASQQSQTPLPRICFTG